jgi:deoxyribonuclease IV
MKFGAHMSIAGGVDKALIRGEKIGCDTIQIFTKNASQWRARELSKEEVSRFKTNQKETGIAPALAHDSYLINIASPDDAAYEKSLEALLVEMKRAEALSLPYLVIHPGAHVGSGEENGLKRIADGLNRLHEQAEGFKVKILLETTAGQGTTLGHCFEHFTAILERVKSKKRLGICFDTAHAFASGYNIKTKKGYAETMKIFNEVIGTEKLLVFHINDSKKPLGSRVDRHEHIGKGYIGKDGLKHLLRDEQFTGHPMILETPKQSDEEDMMNLKLLREIAGR